MKKYLPLIGYLILTLAVAYSVFEVNSISNQKIERTDDRANVAKTRADTAGTRADRAEVTAKKSSSAARRVAQKQVRIVRVLTKAGIRGLSGPTGSPGPVGIRGLPATDEQVRRALATFCMANSCLANPTAEQVAQAIRNFCDTSRCGRDGQDGREGRAPTQEEIDTSVVRYCSMPGNCQSKMAGPTGPEGPAGPPGNDSTVPGPAGPPGPAILSFSFNDGTQTRVCSDSDGDLNYTCVVP